MSERSNILYSIASYKELPLRLHGSFTYPEAYRLMCEWNRKHSAIWRVWLVKAEKP